MTCWSAHSRTETEEKLSDRFEGDDAEERELEKWESMIPIDSWSDLMRFVDTFKQELTDIGMVLPSKEHTLDDDEAEALLFYYIGQLGSGQQKQLDEEPNDEKDPGKKKKRQKNNKKNSTSMATSGPRKVAVGGG